MGLTEKRALDEIIALYNLCFDANSLADRISYIISVQKNMPKFGDWVHHQIAHYYSGDALADGIEAFGDIRGDVFYRGAIPEHKESYAKISDAFEQLILATTGIEKQCQRAILRCAETGDYAFEDTLREINRTSIAPLLKQLIVFYNAIVEYERADDMRKWNKDFKSYVIPAFKGGD